MVLVAVCSLLVTALCHGEPTLVWTQLDLGLDAGVRGGGRMDIDGDGVDEVLVAVTGFFFDRRGHVAALGRGPLGFATRALSPYFHDPGIEYLLVGGPDDGRRIDVIRTGGEVAVLDPASLAVERTIASPLETCTKAVWADLDGDGAPELVARRNDRTPLVVLDSEYRELWEAPGFASTGDFVVGNFDGDPQLEILVLERYASAAHMIDGLSHEEELSVPEGFGYSPVAADLDGDGRSELLVGTGRKIAAYQVSPPELLWEIDTTLMVSLVRTARVGGDLKVIAGVMGAIQSYDAATQEQEWSAGISTMNSFAAMFFADTDGDGEPEAFASAYSANTGCVLVDLATGEEVFREHQAQSPYVASWGDLSGDGVAELVIGSKDGKWLGRGGVPLTADPVTHEPVWDPGVTPVSDRYVLSQAIADVDGDGAEELVLGLNDFRDRLFAGRVVVVEPASGELLWESDFFDHAEMHAVLAADVDADGEIEVVSGGSEGFARCFRGPDGVQKWSSEPQEEPIVQLVAVTPQGGGSLLVAAAHLGGAVELLDGATGTVQASALLAGGASALAVGELDGEPGLELLVGTVDGQLFCLDAETLAQHWQTAYGDEEISGLAVADIELAEGKEIVVGTRRLGIVAAATQEVLWASEPLAGALGHHASLQVGDPDGNGETDLAVGSTVAVFHWVLDPRPTPTPTASPEPTASPTPAITPTAPPSPPPLPTATPTPAVSPTTPADTPTPTVSPTPGGAFIEISTNQSVYRAGDRFQLDLALGSGPSPLAGCLWVILDVYQEYYFWPSWGRDLECVRLDLPPGERVEARLLDFAWPEGAGSASGIVFWAAVTTPDYQELLLGPDNAEFGFE
jgi:outer membrane protein assembly factor BamB